MSRKIKYDITFKYKAVKRILSGESKKVISNELKINKSLLKEWERYYKQFGLEGLRPRTSNRKYNPDFKLMVINQVKNKGLSLRQASLKYGIPSCSSIIHWLRIYEQDGIKGLHKKSKLQIMIPKKTIKQSLSKEQKLLEENKSLKAELDLLKKLHALAQAKKKRL